MVDHNMDRGFLNSSFLVLNIGTNNLEVSNPNVHRNTTEFTLQIQKSTSTGKKKATADSFKSNDENSSKSNGLKRMHDEEKDPEWVPDKRASKSNCSSHDTFKLKEIEVVNSIPQVNRGDSWLMYKSLSGPPPSYLIKLLEYFGWKVEFQEDEYRYVSPNGVPYCSNRKAYEAFLDITSKYNQKRDILSGHDNNQRLGFNASSSLSSLNAKRMHSRIRRSTHANGKSVHVNDNSDDLMCEEDISDFETDVEDNTHKEKKPTETLPFPNLNGSSKRKNPEILISENNTISNGKMQEKKRGGCGLSRRRNRKDDLQDEIISYEKLNIINQLIERGTLAENDRIHFVLQNSNIKTSGLVTKDGIQCFCCKESLSLSKFVGHANGSLDNNILSSGKTFLSCMKEAWEKEMIQKKVGFKNVGLGDPSDDTCAICADGGRLICCDSCPSTFHQSCLMLETLPDGSWFCPYCVCKICRAHGSGNMLSCKECGSKYHKDGCWENDVHLMESVPFSFCGKSCKNVSAELLSILGKKNQTEGGFSWTLLKCLEEDAENISSERLSFIMESNIKLSLALSLLDECFDSLIDRWTGVDMLCQAVYNCGSNFKRLNYEGFYTLILERDDDIISAASLRLHGTTLAEMPFIGTRFMYRKQGMCRRLIKGIEDMLRELRVEKLVIPAIPDMMETLTKSFSFKPLESSHKEEIMNMSLMVFTGITLLQKPIHMSTSVPKAVQTDNSAKCLNNNTAQTKEPPSFLNGQGSSAYHFEFPIGPQMDIKTQSGLGSNLTAIPKQPKPNTSSRFMNKGFSLGNSSNVFGTDSRNLVKSGENMHTSLEIQNQHHRVSQNSIQESQNVPNLSCYEGISADEWGVPASFLKGNTDIMKSPNDTNSNGNVMKSADKGKAHVSSTKVSSKSSDGFVPETSKADGANIASCSNANVNSQSQFTDDVMEMEVLALISLDNLCRSE